MFDGIPKHEGRYRDFLRSCFFFFFYCFFFFFFFFFNLFLFNDLINKC